MFVRARISILLSMMLATEVYCQDLQTTQTRIREQEIKRGSQTAKAGFQNEDAIRLKFDNWRNDAEAQQWLVAMNYSLQDVLEVNASKPHGEKADVEVLVTTKNGQRTEGISIKLVSNPDGYNQIDKRWLKTYARMWNMPEDVHQALRLFVGEEKPTAIGRDSRRMFLNELDTQSQKIVLDFFIQHREEIVADLFAGSGKHAAGWMLVTIKESGIQPANESDRAADDVISGKPRSILVSTSQAAKFFGSGEIQITNSGSLKLGRITIQRKGGDNGRESAQMLQFKINPIELLELNAQSN
jgi:R.HinP1I restriction endonuclease